MGNQFMTYRSFYIYSALFLLTACGHSYPPFEGDSKYYDSDIPKTEKQKVGRPYQIKGQWYKPKIDNGYDEVGIASWYGPGFHGKPTANGERFDEDNLIKAVSWACHNLNSSQEILDYLFNLLRHFIGADRSKDDDTTLVVMKVTQPAEFRQLSAIER